MRDSPAQDDEQFGADADFVPRPRRIRPAPRTGFRLPLRIGATFVRGALTYKQVDQLSSQFGLTQGSLKRLSHYLGVSLDKSITVHYEVDDHASAEAGRDTAVDVTATIAKAKRALEVAVARVQLMEPQPGVRMGDEALVQRFKGRTQVLAQAVSELEALGRRISERDDLVEVITLSDEWAKTDLVRQSVMGVIFAFWASEGRKLSFSTDPITSERTGVLFTYVNAVLSCITDPVTQLSEETIIKELRAWRKRSQSSVSVFPKQPAEEPAT